MCQLYFKAVTKNRPLPLPGGSDEAAKHTVTRLLISKLVCGFVLRQGLAVWFRLALDSLNSEITDKSHFTHFKCLPNILGSSLPSTALDESPRLILNLYAGALLQVGPLRQG